MATEHYLCGLGSLNDAVFRELDDGTVHVVAERGCTNCWDEIVSKERAREMYKELLRDGWAYVATPRRPFHIIRMSLRG
jgi:hypothetical protein